MLVVLLLQAIPPNNANNLKPMSVVGNVNPFMNQSVEHNLYFSYISQKISLWKFSIFSAQFGSFYDHLLEPRGCTLLSLKNPWRKKFSSFSQSHFKNVNCHCRGYNSEHGNQLLLNLPRPRVTRRPTVGSASSRGKDRTGLRTRRSSACASHSWCKLLRLNKRGCACRRAANLWRQTSMRSSPDPRSWRSAASPL